jgi:hypothetical protein
MFSTFNPLQVMPSTYRRCNTSKLFLRISLCWILCLGYQMSYAKDNANDDVSEQAIYGNKDFWSVYPLSVQLNPHFGMTLPIRLHDVAKNDELSTKMLMALGGRADIGLLYARRWLWEHFDCYPKLGLLLKYDFITNNNVAEKGHVMGGVFYIEPNYNHLDGWEVLPRAGVGIAYLNIPGGFSSVDAKSENEEEEAEAYSAADVDPFRQEVDLDIIFDIMFKYRLTPHWHLHFSLGLDYFPALFTNTDDDDDTDVLYRSKKAIEIYTASLGCSYTFNPSKYNPARTHRYPKNLVDLALLSSFRKAYPTKSNTNSGGDQQDDSANKSDKYYYLGGLHVQWSYQFVNNHALVFGSEWIKDWALKKELEGKLKKDNLQVSFMLGHEFLWGRLNFGQYVGFYVLNNANAENKQSILNEVVYARLGLNYRITDYLYVGTSLKVSILPTSKDVAKKKPLEYTRLDYLDFRIGFTF